MQTYRRFASTASSTSRSASTSMHHGHNHPSALPAHGMSRSSSTTGVPVTNENSSSRGALNIVMPSATPSGIARGFASPSNSTTWSPSTPYGTLSSSNLNLSPEPYHRDTHGHGHGHGQTDLHTIAESLLAHVTFGPYHIASSPVPSSHMHTLLAASQSSRRGAGDREPRNMERNKENLNASSTSLSSSATSLYSSSYTPSSVLGPSARRQFEGKEGSHHPSHHHHSQSSHSGHGQQHRLATVNYPLPPLSQLQISTSTASTSTTSSSSTPQSPSTPSSSHTPRSNHPRARFTIGPQEERGRGGRGRHQEEGTTTTRGRGLGRKSVGGMSGSNIGLGLSVREPSSSELWELDEEERVVDEERGRDRGRGARGRRGDVKVLQQ